MTDSNDPDQIRADIERTRAELSYNVDTLGDTVNPSNIANRQVDKAKDKVRSIRDSIMGAPDDPYDQGRAGDLQSKVSDGASAVGDAVANAPALAKQKARGNPLAAGLIAFGLGLLASSLVPASRREQEAVSALQDKVEPLKQQVADAAKEIADNLREPAQQAAESIKTVASDGAQNVKYQAESAKDDVTVQAQRSKGAVQDAHTN